MSTELEGVGQIAAPLDALDHILATQTALGNTDDSIERAIEALSEMVEMLNDGRRPVWREEDRLTTHKPTAARPHHIECQVCHLDKITIYDKEFEAAYLVGQDGRLLLIDTVRYGREHNHYRVRLAGSTVQLPVKATAYVLVSENFNLTGLTMKEARDAKRKEHSH